MPDFSTYDLPVPPILSTYSRDFFGKMMQSGGPTGSAMSATSSAWPTANIALIYPFKLCEWATAYQLLLHIGATTSGNVDIGIYDSQGNRIVSSGSTAAGTINVLQQFNITDTVLSPGDYYLAIGCDNTTCTMFSSPAVPDETFMTRAPVYQVTGLTGPTLPATITPVVTTQTTIKLIVAGIQFRSVL